MKIRFETTFEHLVAFNRYHHAHSPTTRQQRWLVTFLLPGIVALLAGAKTWLDYQNGLGDPMEFMIHWVLLWTFTLVFSLSWILFTLWNFPRTIEKNVRKLLSEGSNRTVLGWRELELVKNHLIIQTKLMYLRLDIRAIDKIVGDGAYTYVYIASVQAYVIPMNLFPEYEYREFVDELRDAWEHREDAVDEPPPGNEEAEVRIVERRH